MTFEEAAAVPVGARTALQFLKKTGVKEGDHVLIYGASGSVGTFAIQIARYFGASVTAVCSTANVDMVKSLGAHKAIDYTKEDFTKLPMQFDIIFDAVGKTSKSACKSLMKPDTKYISVTGSPKANPDDMQVLKELIESGRLRSVIDRTYRLEQIPQAHAYVEKFHKKGNVVVSVFEKSSQLTA
jgi:NADPH:quinone reductase-like Zn-dependent oxidoreductase